MKMSIYMEPRVPQTTRMRCVECGTRDFPPLWLLTFCGGAFVQYWRPLVAEALPLLNARLVYVRRQHKAEADHW